MNSFFHLGVGLVLRKGGVDSRWNLTRMPMHHYAIRMSLVSRRIIDIYPLLGLSSALGPRERQVLRFSMHCSSELLSRVTPQKGKGRHLHLSRRVQQLDTKSS